ncbi:MAG: biosynthetic arginine decarboxylase, partial [Deltaproteobacteria bacterium]
THYHISTLTRPASREPRRLWPRTEPGRIAYFNDTVCSVAYAAFDRVFGKHQGRIEITIANGIAGEGEVGRSRHAKPALHEAAHLQRDPCCFGKPHHLGLEAGSKPELLVAIALLEGDDALLVCNGYKDAEYIETALYAQWLGLKPYLVLDRFAELDLIIEVAKRTGIRPHIGMRAKLSTRGSGRWKDSTGDRSKFGLSAREMVHAVDKLRQADMLDCLELLHFHIGSQITAIKSLKDALREAMHLYCDLRRLGAEKLNTVDCGGGLAVDYDGSRTNFHSSMNYSTQEYANDVVSILQDICDNNDMPHPAILTESGRALVAQHSVLIFNVLGIHEFAGQAARDEDLTPTDAEHDVIHRMWEAYNSVN